MVVGGMWLIAKQKIYIDRESKQPVEIKLPLGVSVKSNYPALALFALGFFPLVYPLRQINTLTEYVTVDTVRIKGLVEADAYPVLVYASRAQDVLNKNGEFRVPVPFLGKAWVLGGQLLPVSAQVRRPERDATGARLCAASGSFASRRPSYPAPDLRRLSVCRDLGALDKGLSGFLRDQRSDDQETDAIFCRCGMAERVGFEPDKTI